MAALSDPASFLGFARVFPDEVANDARFRAAFVGYLQRLEREDPLAIAAAP